MAPDYSTEQRYLYLKNPVTGLLLTGFTGHEAISELFWFDLDLRATNRTNIEFDKLLGQKAGFGIEAGDHEKRPFHGIVTRFTQFARDKEFTHYRMRIEPHLWLLTQRVRSRIFQHISIPDILKKVLTGIDVAFEIQGTFHPRDFCVQYLESDFDFASRLMEEEGIYYFFKFSEDGHTLVLANTPQSHPDVPGDSKLIYEEMEGGTRDEERISAWEKEQDLRSGKYTLWDHSFQLPYKNLEAEKTVIDTVQAGKVTHKLKIAGNEKLEVYEYPGGYASRFDGVDKGGGSQDSDLQKIFEDNKRVAGIRMQQLETPMLEIRGASNYRQMIPGYKFTLQRHFNADGQYTIVSAHHEAYEGSYRSSPGSEVENHYGNSFTCIPLALPYRPARRTARPFIHGCQTAIVSGPEGEEIFTDKYGRIKVQFHWDREGQGDADSSCWVRVATTSAGKGWGAISIPRIGQEVIVDFLEGDPDRPIVIGCVYNADMMPSYGLPAAKIRSGMKSRSSPGGGGFNEIRMDDTKSSEQLFINAQYDFDLRVGHDCRETVANDRHRVTGQDLYEEVGRDGHFTTKRDHIHDIGRDIHQNVAGKAAHAVGDSYSLKVGSDAITSIGSNQSETIGQNLVIKAGVNIVLEGGAGVTIKGPGGHVTVGPAGVMIVGNIVLINSGGAPLMGTPGNLVPPTKPSKAMLADTAQPGGASYKTQRAAMAPMELEALAAAAAPSHVPSSEENKKKTAWVEVSLENSDGTPAAGESYRVTVADGSVYSGTLDDKGLARVEGLDPGSVKVTFPELDKEAWEPK